ncbi:MAG: nitrilase-related carbon-nitrogen hydrolase [Collinsella sp.]|nr:nitrilase-related carbon-nitrogen hydrolase [Collinsella sp.]
MKAGYIQFDVKRAPEDNLNAIGRLLERVDADILVLPELCMCGYLFESRADLLALAQPVPQGAFCQSMMRASRERGCSIVFGMPELDGNRLFNTAVVVDSGRYVGRYRKTHLTTYEQRLFERGHDQGVFKVGGVTIGVQICFDLWFPEISRKQLRSGAQVLCALANFGGETTCDVARIRALENQTPLVLCNRIGVESSKDLDADFLGRSAIIAPDGTPCLEAPRHREAAHVSELPKERPSSPLCSDFLSEIEIHYR